MSLAPYGKDIGTGHFRPFKTGDTLTLEDGTPVIPPHTVHTEEADTTDEPSPNFTSFNDLDVAIFDPTIDQEIQFLIDVPQQISLGTIEMKARVNTTTAEAAKAFVAQVEFKANGDSSFTDLGTMSVGLGSSADTDEVVSLYTGVSIGPTDTLVLKFARRASDGSDTHGGGLRLLDFWLEQE